jgi:hypothetical protein
MRFLQPILGQVRFSAQKLVNSLINAMMYCALLCTVWPAEAQNTIQPALGSSCTISALNRNAPVAPDNSFTIYNIPGNSGPFRARATCSDGTVGQTPITFPELASGVVYTGEIVWGQLDPAPIALQLSAANKRLSTNQTAQLAATAIADNATTRDVTLRLQGTSYAVSNPLMASITQDGLIQILPLFASGSSARVVVTATNEGGVGASTMFVLGPRGVLSGKVTRADGSTPVAGAQVTVLRHQPMEQVGTVSTDASGNYVLPEVNAGTFTISVIDPSTGDRGQTTSKIETDGETKTSNIQLNGQGQIVVTVIDAANNVVPNALVTMTALGRIRDTRSLLTDSAGKVTFSGVAAGDFTVSTRDTVSKLVGTAVGVLTVGGVNQIALKLQPIGTINGTILSVDGVTAQEGVQVRILSRERGIVSQLVTGANGQFSFNSLPLSDGPYTIDAFVDGRLRARVPGIVLSTPNQVVTQDVRFSAIGTIRGIITDANSQVFDEVSLTLQSLEGLRLTLTAKAGSDGSFMLQGVPVGNFTIAAVTKDGRAGNAVGNMPADGAEVTLNLQLAATGITGTVFQRDGVTPVGAGVQVYLQRDPKLEQLALTLDSRSEAVVGSTTTDGKGQFGFAISSPGTYVIQAQSDENRGRTQTVITTIVSGQPMVSNIAYIGKGTVTGVVKDSSGAIQAGVPVKVKTVGAFTNTWTVTTDATGRYVLNGVFVGDVSVTAQNPVSKLAGAANGRLIAEGDNLALNITLAATGTVRGKVMKSNNVTPAKAPILLELYAGQTLINAKTIIDSNNYEFSLVPVGDIRIVATEVSTNDKGTSATRLTAPNEERTLDLTLIGQGAVRVKVQDSANNPVEGASIFVHSLSAFSKDEVTLISDSKGMALFQPVFNGDFTVSASKPAQIGAVSGNASGTVVNGATVDAQITLVKRPTGKISGVVFEADGVTPRRDVLVYLTPAPDQNSYRAVTDKFGKYVLENIEGGVSYTLNAKLRENDRIRARVLDVTIDTQDQVLTKNLQLLGSGSIAGRVTLAGGAPAAGVKVVFNNPDPIFGRNPGNGSFEMSTDGEGRFLFPDLPSGNFTLRAQNISQTLQAETANRIKFDGDSLNIDLVLVDSAVTMPYTLNDANAIPFDIAGDGSVINGKNSVFTGSGPDTRGMRLDVLVNGIPVPFKNGDGTIGRLSQSKQQIEVDELHTSGLNVTRRIYVPKDGYFARYLEILENKTQAPITVDVRVTSHHSQSNSNPRIVDSSDGDNVLSVSDSFNRDRWIIVDDQEDVDPYKRPSIPATGHIFDGLNGKKQVDSASYELIGQTGKLIWQWNSITLQPGQSTALMHFAFSQLNRSNARDAAVRLAQLPPEAMLGLEAEDISAIANFSLPASGVSQLTALPALNGEVFGKVFSGDGITPIVGAQIQLKSKHTLFGRDFITKSDAAGQFRFKANVDGTTSAMPIPLYGLNIDATHPVTGATSAASVGDFEKNLTTLNKDLIFNGTANIRGTVTRHNGKIVSGANIKLPLRGGSEYRTVSGDDGSYLMTGVPSKDYVVSVSKPHPQMPRLDDCCGIEGKANVTAIESATTVADVNLEPVGSITGIVRAANGNPVVGAKLKLIDSLQRDARVTITDTAGRYRFSDVKLGSTSIAAFDEVSKAEGSVVTVVAADTESTADIQLKGFGTINVYVNFARGIPAPGAPVQLEFNNTIRKITDAAGLASFSLPIDTYKFVADHPANIDDKNLSGDNTVSLINNGDIASITIMLKPAGAIRGTIVRPDQSTLAGGFPYTVRLLNGAMNERRSGVSDEAGNFRMNGLSVGRHLLTAYDPQQNRFADTEVLIQTDGEEITAHLKLEDNRIALPANLFDANRFQFDVQSNGSLAKGSSAFVGASVLEVNGQIYTGDTSALLEAGKRQFAITQPTTVSGLHVTRKVFVPRGAYFARYLEIFTNPTANPINFDAKVSTTYPIAKLIASSSGGGAVTNKDNWVVLDDELDEDPLIQNQQPSMAHVHGQSGARVSADLVELAATGNNNQKFTQRWRNLTVPAGSKLVLMHFVVQQINRNGAQVAAQRLSQLPPEAIDALTPEENAAIANFNVPADGSSAIQALPILTGNVSGRVFEGDGVTPINDVRVTFQSSHPLFNRVWGKKVNDDTDCQMAGTSVVSLLSRRVSNANQTSVLNGSYSLQGTLSDEDSIVLPVGSEARVVVQEPRSCFDWAMGHSLTHIPSRQYVIPKIGMSNNLDVLFDSGILTGTVTGPADFSVADGKVWRATEPPPFDGQPGLFVPIARDGTYVFPGLSPGKYDIVTGAPHPQGSGLRGERTGAVVTLGKTTVTDILLQETGAIFGTVLTANGEASVNTEVKLSGAANDQQYDACVACTNASELNLGKRNVALRATTDSLGRYSFAAVPTGAYMLSAIDPVSKAIKTQTLNVSSGQHVTQNLILLSLGSVQLLVTKADGSPTVDANVYLFTEYSGVEKVVGRTDAAGKLTVANIPFGNYRLRVPDPRRPQDASVERLVTGVISTNGEVQQKTIAFLTIASLRLSIQDGDNGNKPISDAKLTVNQRQVGTSDINGIFFMPTVEVGNVDVIVQSYLDGILVSKTLQIAIDKTDDGKVRDVAVVMHRPTSKFGALTFARERDIYSLPLNAGDVLSLSVKGVAVGSTPSAYAVRAEVYDIEKSLLARGYGYDAKNQFKQFNEYGSLENVTAALNGKYSVAISPYYDSQVGGYELRATVNGAPVTLQPYMDGGVVTGLVTKADGITPLAGAVVRIKTLDTLGLYAETVADSNGKYTFTNVPLGEYKLSVVRNEAIVGESVGTLRAVNDVSVTNIRQIAATVVRLQVKNLDGSDLNGRAVVKYKNSSLSVNQSTGTDIDGRVSFAFTGDEAIELAVTDDSNSMIAARTMVNAADGQTVDVAINLPISYVSGKVVSSTGAPVRWSTVRAVSSSDSRLYIETRVDDFGKFSLHLLANQETLLLAKDALSDSNSGFVRIMPTTTVINDVVVTLPGQGRIKGSVLFSTGRPVPVGTTVSLTWSDPWYVSERYKSTQTDTDGNFEFASYANIPTGVPLSLNVNVIPGGESTRQIMLTADGEQLQVQPLIIEVGAAIKASLRAADGSIGSLGYCNFIAEAVNVVITKYAPCDSEQVMLGLPAGKVRVSIGPEGQAAFGSVEISAVLGKETSAIVRVSKVDVQVRYADSTPAFYATVYLTDEMGVIRYAQRDPQSERYAIFGVPNGQFTVTAQDDYGLSSSLPGQLIDPNTIVNVDLTTPVFGSVNVTIVDSDNQPVPSANVQLRYFEFDFDRAGQSDAEGRYTVEHVALGGFTVSAYDPIANRFVSAVGKLNAAGQVLSVKLQFPATRTVSGRVFASDGINTVANAQVELRQLEEASNYIASATTDSSGSFTIENVPVGMVKLVAVDSNSNVGSAIVEVKSTGNNATNVILGLERQLPITWAGADDHKYTVDTGASFAAYRDDFTRTAFSYSYGNLVVNGIPFQGGTTAKVLQDGREILIGPRIISGLLVSRRYYVPGHGKYVRVLDMLSNHTTADINAVVKIKGLPQNPVYPAKLEILSATENYTAFRPFSNGDDLSFSAIYKGEMGGIGPQKVSFSKVTHDYSYNWNILIPAGKTVSVVNFGSAFLLSDLANAQARAEVLSNGTESNMWDGLTASEKATILNFRIP